MMSLEDLQRALNDAVIKKFATSADDQYRWYVMETFPSYVIVRGPDDQLLQVAYAVNVSGEIELGEAKEVEQVYVPVSEAARFADEDGADDWTFPVQVMQSGWANGQLENVAGGAVRAAHYFPQEVLGQVAEALNGTRFGRRHPPEGDLGTDDADRVAGWFTDGAVAGNTARANLHLLENETELQAKLAAARKAKKLDLFGLSIFGLFAFKPKKVEGRDALVATKLAKLFSVDLCAEAGAGGKFLVAATKSMFAEISELQGREVKQAAAPVVAAAAPSEPVVVAREAAAAATSSSSSSSTRGDNRGTARAGRQNEGANMKERILKVLESLRKRDAGRAEELTTEFTDLPEAQQGEFLLKVTEALSAIETTVQSRADSVLKELELRAAKMNRDEKIAEAKLPAGAAKLVREHLDALGKAYTDAEIDGEIKRVREAFAAYSNVGRVTAGTSVIMGRDTTDKIQAAMDAMFGVKEALADKNVKPFRSLKDSYIFCTGDHDLEFGRNGRGGMLVREATNLTTDYANLLANSMTKRALQDYAEVGMGGLDQIVDFTDIPDFKTQDRVRLGYLGDLATVAEDGPYTDFAKPTDEKISYAATKRGNLFPVSRETILNDDLRKLTTIASRIGRAARRTLKQFITNFYLNNPAYDVDATAWFHATHGNLGANALSVDELIARQTALMNQTEKDSGKPLGLKIDWLMVPNALWATAWKINKSEFYNPGPNIQEPNPFYLAFGQNGERIITNELLTDANDWYYGALPAGGPHVEVGFVQGQREPAILIQSDPAQGGVFTNDRVTYKVRHEYGGDVVDFRPVGKNVVP